MFIMYNGDSWPTWQKTTNENKHVKTQQQIKTEATKDAARDFFGELLGAADLTGQKVDVAESPLAKIDYLYDFGSIFGTPQQGALFPTPYGNIGGRKQGGLIERNKELLRVIGED